MRLIRCSSAAQAKLRPRIAAAEIVPRKVRRSMLRSSCPSGTACRSLTTQLKTGRAGTRRKVLASDFSRGAIPHRGCFLEIRVVRHVTADGGVVAELLVFYRLLSATESIEEIR